MPQVPSAPIRTVEQQGYPGVRVDQSAPVEAFGGGGAAAQVNAATQTLAQEGVNLKNDETLRTNQIAVNQGVSQAKARATDIQLQAQKMQGQDAYGAPDFVQKQWEQAKKDIRDSMTNGAQKATFDMHANDLYDSLYKTTQEHVFKEGQAWDDKATSSFIDNSKNRAVVNATRPEIVASEIEQQRAAINDWAKRKGVPRDSEEYKAHSTDVLSATHAAVISELLDANKVDAATQHFSANKDSMDAKDVMMAEKRIENSKDVSLSMSVYNQVHGFKLSDGTPDEERMIKAVRELPDMTDERRLKIENFVRAKAGEDRRWEARQQEASDSTFKSNAVKLQKNGQPLEEAMKLPVKFAANAYDQALKEQFVHELYSASAVKTDEPTKVALMDGIDAGTVTQAQIDKAYYKDRTISGGDWAAARAAYRKTVIDGKTPGMQRANEELDKMAKAQFGSDKDAAAAFKSSVKTDGFGKSPEELVKIANDKLKEDKSTASHYWNWLPVVGGQQMGSGDPQYKTDEAKRSADYLTLGKFHQDLGVDTVKSIAASNPSMSPAEAVNKLSLDVGGYDKMKPGTPAYNAIQSLSNAGKVVSAATIKRVLDSHPDGVFVMPPKPSLGAGRIPKGRR